MTDILGVPDSGTLVVLDVLPLDNQTTDVVFQFIPSGADTVHIDFTLSEASGPIMIEAVLFLRVLVLFDLTVSLHPTIEEAPSGNAVFVAGSTVGYAYQGPDCNDPLVHLDGEPVDATGTVLMDRDHDLLITAVPAPIYIDISIVGMGSVESNCPNPTYCGQACEYEAIPGPCYEFTGWTGDYNTPDNPLLIANVARDVDLVANFELLPGCR